MRNLIPAGFSPVWYWIGLFGVLVVYLFGAQLDLMDIDAAQYGLISRDMLASGNWLFLYERGRDYLDKPPLLFWSSAVSFAVLGVTNFAYRVFPILSSLAGAYGVYRFGKTWYNARTGQLAAMMLLSCQAYFLINHDVRTDTMLANATMLAIWQLSEYVRENRYKNLVLGFAFIGLAMLAKGPLGLMVPVLAFSTDFILKRQWGNFFRWQWLVGLGVTALVILPYCVGLYQQFDMHPEKVVNNRTGTSGLYFYLWNHSFGRITGEDDFIKYVHNETQGSTDYFFFVHTFLWSFLPWPLFYFIGLFGDLRRLGRQRFRFTAEQEALTLGGFVLTVVAVSFSQYKLPHHFYVALPLATIPAGKALNELISSDKNRGLYRFGVGFQAFASVLIWGMLAWLAGVCFPMTGVWKFLVAGAALAAAVYLLFFGKNRFERLVMPALLSVVGGNFLMNAHVYPALFEYQAETVLARFARHEAKIPPRRMFAYTVPGQGDVNGFSVDFYSETYIGDGKPVETRQRAREVVSAGPTWFVTNAAGLADLRAAGFAVNVLKTTPRFRISMLSGEFLNPETRAQTLETAHLVGVRL